MEKIETGHRGARLTLARRRLLEAGAAGVAWLASSASAATSASGGGHSGSEPAIEPALPIVDAHHHLYDDPGSERDPRRRYLLPDLLADIADSGHTITHTVFVQHGTSSMYRADGFQVLKPVGEVEFANGIAAMSASGRYGPCRVAAGIVAAADMSMGAAVKPVLEALVAAGDGRLRGIRFSAVYADMPLFGAAAASDPSRKAILSDPKVRAGIAELAPLGLSLDTWCFYPQIDEVSSLAAALPETTIILNHLGGPLYPGRPAERSAEAFSDWRRKMNDLARRPNVVVKLGGLGMAFGAPVGTVNLHKSSVELASRWRPYIETAIAAFGPDRCMFESNFPPDASTCSYGTIWNTFKRLSVQYSPGERTSLFGGTAKRVYRL